MKTCFKCNQEKPVLDFYKHPQMKDGHLGKCKECCKKEARANGRLPHVRAYDMARSMLPHRVKARQEYAKTERGKERQRAGNLAWKNRNSEKRKAQIALGNAVRDGKLIKQPCEKCGTGKAHGHHEDYSKPLDVIWLCHKCHRRQHKGDLNGERQCL